MTLKTRKPTGVVPWPLIVGRPVGGGGVDDEGAADFLAVLADAGQFTDLERMLRVQRLKRPLGVLNAELRDPLRHVDVVIQALAVKTHLRPPFLRGCVRCPRPHWRG